MRRVVTMLILAAVAGCATPPPAKPDGGTPRAPAKPTADADGERAGQRAGKGETFTAEERARMEVAWEAFKDESPTWPALRDEWIGMGDRARNTLVENLIRTMIVSRLANYPQGALRARNELVLIGSSTIPTVEGVLQNPTYFDSGEGKVVRLPTEVQTELNELLLIAGEPAVPSLVRLTKSEVPTVRRNAMDSLGRLKVAEGIPVLASALRNSSHWIDRMTAARALGYGTDPAATRALVAALDDRDETVVIEAARALARQGAREALPALDRRREKAKAVEDYRVSRACGDAAKIIRSAEQ